MNRVEKVQVRPHHAAGPSDLVADNAALFGEVSLAGLKVTGRIEVMERIAMTAISGDARYRPGASLSQWGTSGPFGEPGQAAFPNR